MATLIVETCHTHCSCGYGGGSWASSPALQDPPLPILSPDSTECPGCSETFTNIEEPYKMMVHPNG